jgi:hypothetical protein
MYELLGLFTSPLPRILYLSHLHQGLKSKSPMTFRFVHRLSHIRPIKLAIVLSAGVALIWPHHAWPQVVQNKAGQLQTADTAGWTQ